MSDNSIKQQPPVQSPTAPPNPERGGEPIAAPADGSTYAGGNENGGIYFELNWDTGQAQQRQRQLLSNYSGGTTGENSGYNPNYGSGYNPEGNSAGGSYYGFNGESYSPESNGYGGYHYGSNGNQYSYGGNPNQTIPYGYNGGQNETLPYNYTVNSTFPGYYAVQSNENGSLYSTENSTPLSWNDFVNLVSNHPDFRDFRNKSNDFWRDVRQFSEPPVFQNQDGVVEPEDVSRYEKLLHEFKSRDITLDKFVENLPPNEREIFKARYQIDQTFGEDIFEADGLTLNEKGQTRARETATAGGQFEDLPETVQTELQSKVVFINEKGERFPTRRDAAIAAENTLLSGENIPANRFVSEKIEANELKPQDKSAQIAVGNNAGSILTDNGAARAVNHAVSTDASSSVSSINARRDGGTVLGGALISGSFASIENFKNSENKSIGNLGSVSSAGFGGRNSFAAGATGAMMSAAIGSLVPGSDAVVSGVVGFVSGVVIGVEADQGLRWLSGDRPTAIASSGGINLLEENSFA